MALHDNQNVLERLVINHLRKSDAEYQARKAAFNKFYDKIVQMFDGKLHFHINYERLSFDITDTNYFLSPIINEDGLQLFKEHNAGSLLDERYCLYTSTVTVTNLETLAKAMTTLKEIKK